MIKPRTFFMIEHGNKEKAFETALNKAGWKRVSESSRATISLFDADGTAWRNRRIEKAAQDSVVVIYPHAAHPPYWYDCGLEWSEHVTLNLVPAPVHKWMLEYSNYPHPARVVGWSYSPMSSFRPSRQLKKVLFAPRHPNANGYLADEDKENNRRAFDILIDMWTKYGFQLTVRHLHSLESCGLDRRAIDILQEVIFIMGRPDLVFDQIEQADLIVSTQTFAYMSIARGKPTVMYGEETPPHYGNCPDDMYWAKSWDCYKERMKYPYDLFEMDGNAWEILNQNVIHSDCGIQSWKNDHIGQPFDHRRFVDMMDAYRFDPEH